ncbi:unannotated protein [freshwater metagenome]|uniref:Unannotated protein n=1 Tax=freshwater metagenome TaxID=449393 RepID=A0A6J6R6G3_9ZZZZ
MGDNHHCEFGLGFQVLSKPSDYFNVEVVGRLIK